MPIHVPPSQKRATPLLDAIAKNGHANTARRRHARMQVKNALKRGALPKPTTCPRCSVEDVPARRMHAHHPDYDQPLVVEWLCARCDAVEHGALPVGEVRLP